MEQRWHIKKLKPYSQALRKNMTDQERHLWYDFLKDLPVTVKRQRIINGYIADFYIPSARLVIELDGSQHYTEDGIEYDSVRSGVMESLGLTVLRYSNAEINSSFSSVCEDILAHLTASKPSPDGEGGICEANDG